MIQSRWFKKDAYDQDGIESVLQIANESLQREGQPLPGRALLLGGDLKMTSSANGIPFEFLKDRDASSEDGDPVLWKAALNAYQTASVFDFTPPVWEKKRRDRRLAKERTSLFLWVVVFSAALCFLALTRVLSVGIESAWLAFKRAPLTESTKDLKALQTKALSAGTYQQRKIFPVLLLEKLRAAVPAGVLLVKLEYDQTSALFLMRGESVSENFIHDFLGALQKQPLLTGLKLDRVEARQEDGGRIYEFEIKGFLGSRSPA